MGESDFNEFIAVIEVIQSLMIIIGLTVMIIALVLAIILMVRLLSFITALRRTGSNLEEASGIVLSSTKEVSKTLGFFGIINRVAERIRERFSREGE